MPCKFSLDFLPLQDINDKVMRDQMAAVTDKSRLVNGKPTTLAELGFDWISMDDVSTLSLFNFGWNVTKTLRLFRRGSILGVAWKPESLSLDTWALYPLCATGTDPQECAHSLLCARFGPCDSLARPQPL